LSEPPLDIVGFIIRKMPLAPVRAVPAISLHTAHASSGLWQFLESTQTSDEHSPPYWAYPWAGGAVLARYLLDRPAHVRGRKVLDLGSGSGLVGIAAAKAHAADVLAAETDPNGLAAIRLNAAANGVVLRIVGDDLLDGPLPDVDIVAAGDVFYAEDLASRVVAFFDRCVSAGMIVLVGDPGRVHLPRARLRLLAEYPVADFGEPPQAQSRPAAVFAFEAAFGNHRPALLP